MARKTNQDQINYNGLIKYQSYDVFDKGQRKRDFINNWLNKLSQMFRYENLPDTMPQREVELMLMTNGITFGTNKQNGKDLYMFAGGWGGAPDVYYKPTKYIVSNPYLNYNATLDVVTDGVLFRNDTMGVGVMPLLSKYADAIVENDISIRIQDVNARASFLITATDSASKDGAEKFLKDLYDGKPGVAMTSAFLEGIKVNPLATSTGSNAITQLIELEQYLKAGLITELGLNYNHNMKREALNSNETSMGGYALLPLIDDMLKQRQEAWGKFNEMYGTDVRVELNSAWDLQHEELQFQPEEEDTREVPEHDSGESEEPDVVDE